MSKLISMLQDCILYSTVLGWHPRNRSEWNWYKHNRPWFWRKVGGRQDTRNHPDWLYECALLQVL